MEDERYLAVALFQGVPKGRKKAKMEFAMGNEMVTVVDSDPTVVAAALARSRFYLFTKREPEDVDDVAQVRNLALLARCVQQHIPELDRPVSASKRASLFASAAALH